MPKGQTEKDGDDGATAINVTETEQHTALEQRQGPKLNEISRKLSLILTAIEHLTETVKENQTPTRQETSTDSSSTLSEISNVLTQLSERIPSQAPSQPTTTSSNTDNEDEATRIKTGMANLWSFKLTKRKEAYWNMVENQGHRNKYQDWLERENIIVPRFLQKKEFNYEHEDQKAVRGKAVLNDFKAEIELRDLRAKQHEQRYQQLDEEMERCLKAKSGGRVASILIQMWKAETTYQETISNRRWRRSARWLDDYETKFLEEYRNRNPFFKKTEDQIEEPVTDTQRPNQASGTEQGIRNNTGTQNDFENATRQRDTPRPRMYKQRYSRPQNIQRPRNTQPSFAPLQNNKPDYQRPSTSREHTNRDVPSGNLSSRPRLNGLSGQTINIELDDDSDYFLDKPRAQRH